MPNSNKLIFKNTIFLYARSVLILLLSLYTSRVLLHTLGVEDYGLYNVIAGFVAMFGFLNSAMVNSIQRFMNFALGKNDDRYFTEVFESSILIQFIVAVLIVVLAETIGLWFVKSKMNIPVGSVYTAHVIYQFAIFTFVIKIIQVPFTSIIVSHERMSFFALQGILEAVLLLLIIYIVSVLPGEVLISYAVLLFVVTIMIFALNVIYAKRVYRRMTFRLMFDELTMKEMMSFTGWNLLGSFSGVLKSQGINVLLNMFFNVVVNAARGIAYQVLSGVMAMIGNFQMSIKPQLIQSYAEGNEDRYFSLVYNGSKITFYLMWILVLPLILSIDQVLDLWLGAGSIPEYTAMFTVLVLLSGLVDSYATTISLAIYAIGNIKWYQIIVSLIIIAILPISYFMLKNGAAPQSAMYVSLAVSVFAQVIRVVIWRSLIKFPLKDYLQKVICPTVSVSILSYFICRMVSGWMSGVQSDFLYLVLMITLTVVVNCLIILFCGFKASERKSFYNWAVNKIKG